MLTTFGCGTPRGDYNTYEAKTACFRTARDFYREVLAAQSAKSFEPLQQQRLLQLTTVKATLSAEESFADFFKLVCTNSIAGNVQERSEHGYMERVGEKAACQTWIRVDTSPCQQSQ